MSESLTRYHASYSAKKALFSFMGNTFRMYAPDGSLAFFIKQKAFKLKEAITVYADEGQTDAMLTIQARSVMDISATYDITDAKTGENVGAMKRKGLKSMFRDEWAILDTSGSEVGHVKESSALMSMLSRLFKIVPQKYEVALGGAVAGTVAQKFNPFQLGYDVRFDGPAKLDPRMGVAAVVLLLAVEGVQQ